MRRRLFNAVSLLLLVPSCEAWLNRDIIMLAGYYVQLPSGRVLEAKSFAVLSVRALWWLGIPPMAAAALSLILPIVWYAELLYRERGSRQRAASQICVSCGYDLRATPDRCPECGTIPAGVAK
jgi:hypothetical protein